MTIQTISAVSVALYLTPGDLQAHGLQAQDLTEELTLTLTRDAFQQAGIALTGPVEVETYPGQCGVLIFVYISPPRQTVWEFENSEALLLAVSALQDRTPDSALYYWASSFWLVLPGQEPDVSARLSEFAGEQSDDPYLLPRLNEYGTLILPTNAIAILQQHFIT